MRTLCNRPNSLLGCRFIHANSIFPPRREKSQQKQEIADERGVGKINKNNMKTDNITKTEKLPPSRRPIVDTEAIELDYKLREHQFDAANEIDLQKVERIKYLENLRDRAGAGIGFIDFGKPSERLVEYTYNGVNGFQVEEITLKQSVAWARHMDFAALRFADAKLADLVQIGPEGDRRWFEIIDSALE